MKIMVTGGAGYVGGTVAGLLAQQGHSVVVVDNLCHAQRNQVPAGVEFVEADIADRARIEGLFRDATAVNASFDGVLHFAALIEAGESMQKPEIYFRNNTASTLALLEAILACGPKRIVFSSTAAVYGEPEAVPIPETAKLKPTNPYGESKLLVEYMLEWFHRIHGLRSASLRYFNVAGAPEVGGHGTGKIIRGEAHEPESHIIPLVLDVALGRRSSIKIFGDDYPTKDGTCVRDYVHVADLADAHLLALAALETPLAAEQRLIYNLGNGAGFTVKEVVESARRVTGHPIPVELCPRRAGDPAFLIATSEKAIAELNWKPNYTQIDDIIRTAWLWHQIRHSK
ncbi:UDP-glucose 4-epimerase GalE [Acidicapsa ligni]|uniref:UDP-glucose 4-epimerase GalE n=1 Tax=Acidicapsa ligni TaxID=542300 RepID=UPI0021E0C068|nr:UDP-glucose 4-epimerase GalE [Acidicapsa ligni]